MNLVLMLFGFIITLLVLELLLNLYNPFNWRAKRGRIVLQTNKTYRIENNTIKNVGSEVIVIKNSLGFRGAGPPADFGSALTIVTMGGSSTQGYFLNEDETWTARLGQK